MAKRQIRGWIKFEILSNKSQPELAAYTGSTSTFEQSV